MVHLASKLDHCIKPVMTLTYFSVTKDIVIIAQWKETSRALHIVVSRSQTAFSSFRPNIKEEKAVWLRETMHIEGSLRRGRPPLSFRVDVIQNHVGIDYLIPDLISAIQVCQIRIYRSI